MADFNAAIGSRLHEAFELARDTEDLIESYGYWEEHPEYPLHQWCEAVRLDETRLVYWAWIANAQRPCDAEPKNE